MLSSINRFRMAPLLLPLVVFFNPTDFLLSDALGCWSAWLEFTGYN